MAQKPDIMSLNDFVKVHQESFISYELWLIDELTEYLVAKRDLEKPSVSIIIDIDSENPVHSVDDALVNFRFNGRFYIPVSDKKDRALNLTSDQWIELLQTWFAENELKVVIGEKAADFVKFTVIMSVLELPEQTASEDEGDSKESEAPAETPTEPSGPSEETGPSEEIEPSETGPSEESNTEAPTETETEDDTELKEFEEALGL